MEQPEALGRRLGRRRPGRFLRGVARVELGDDGSLLLDAVGRQPAGDGQRLGVVGQDLVGVAAPAGRLGHDLDRVRAVRPVRVAVQVAAQVAELDEARQRARPAPPRSRHVLAQLGLDERQAEEGVRLRLGGEGPELGGVAGERLAVLADAQEALLGQAPALVAGPFAQPDVVFLGPGEVDPVRAGLPGRHDHQVGLRPAKEADRGLVAALVDDVVDDPEGREPLDQAGAVVGLGEEVEIADALAGGGGTTRQARSSGRPACRSAPP